MRLILLIGFVTTGLLAQEYRGTILGRITDPTGSAIASTAVEIVNVDTSVVMRTDSNETGNYQVPFLLPGNYKIRVQRAGFRTVDRENVRLSTNQQLILDFQMDLGSTSETVTVTANAPLLNAASADLGQVIDSTYVTKIAVSLSRNAVNVMALAPGVTGNTGTYTSNAQSDRSIAGGGSTRGRNEFLVDGIPNTVPQGGGLVVFVPSLDAVEEVKVHTTMFDAAYGHSNGGAVNIVTRSGTNQLHGVGYLYKRWTALNANTWTNNSLGLPKPPVNYHQWGYTVGGPVWIPKLYDGRNRTFFMTSLERDSDARDLGRQSRVPTEAERQGDFSNTLARTGGPLMIYDPDTTTVSGGTATRQPFPGARIPAHRLSPIGQAVLRAYPLPNIEGPPQIGRFNWAAAGVYTVSQGQASVRIDHNAGSRHRLFGRFGRLTREQIADELFPGVLETGDAGGTDLGVLTRAFYNFGFDDTITFSPTFIGSLRYGLARRSTFSAAGAYEDDPSMFNLPQAITQNQATPGWPAFRLGEGTATIGTNASREANDMHALLGNFTKLTGRHSVKFGVDYRLTRWNRLTPGGAASGDFTFSPVFTQSDPFTARSADTSGSGMASLLLGAPASGSLGYNSPLSLQNHYLGLFVQEDWKVTPRLTLTAGVRYELETPYTERFNRVSHGFDENAALPVSVPGLALRGGILFAGIDGNPRQQGKTDWNNFGPRFGFAFSLSPKLVIRGGYGIFYSGQSFNTGFLGDVGVFNAITSYIGTTDNGATIFTTLANPFPTGLRQPIGSSAGTGAQLGDTLSFFDDRRVSPYNQQWQFSIQRELPARIVVEAAYMGMRSLKQFESFNLNEKPDQYLALGTAENNRVPNPFLGTFPPTSVLGQGTTITQNRLWSRYPQFATLTLQGANTGSAIYHSLQLRVEKRLTRGLSFLWTYTNSKLIDNNTTSVINERKYRAISEFDQPQVMRMAFVYELPTRFESRVARFTLGGWSVAGLLQFASGTPLSVNQANGRPIRLRNAALSGPTNERLGDHREGSRVLNPYFDITAFQPLASQYVVSPEPPRLDELRAPGTRSLNASLFKTFPIRERMRAEVRLETTGVTNTPQFAPPGTNMSNAATFGVITSAEGARAMQLGLRFVF